MNEEQIKIYTQVKERMRRLGKENPADVILYLELEVRAYRRTIRRLKDELDKSQTLNRLHEQDVKDWRKLAERKVEEIYPEFMSDYKCALEELDGLYDELAELRKDRDELRKERDELREDKRVTFPIPTIPTITARQLPLSTEITNMVKFLEELPPDAPERVVEITIKRETEE